MLHSSIESKEMNSDHLMRPAVFPASTNWPASHPFMEFVKYKKMPV